MHNSTFYNVESIKAIEYVTLGDELEFVRHWFIQVLVASLHTAGTESSLLFNALLYFETRKKKMFLLIPHAFEFRSLTKHIFFRF